MLKVDDVNFVTRTKDVFAHLWIPETSLVTKVCASCKKVAHAYVVICHFLYLKVWVRPPYIRILHLYRHPEKCVDICADFIAPSHKARKNTFHEKAFDKMGGYLYHSHIQISKSF